MDIFTLWSLLHTFLLSSKPKTDGKSKKSNIFDEALLIIWKLFHIFITKRWCSSWKHLLFNSWLFFSSALTCSNMSEHVLTSFSCCFFGFYPSWRWTPLTFMMTGGHVVRHPHCPVLVTVPGPVPVSSFCTRNRTITRTRTRTSHNWCWHVLHHQAGDSFAFLLSCRFSEARTKHKSNCTALC